MTYKHVEKLKVWVYDKPVGILERLTDSSIRFTYYKNIPAHLMVSLGMPVCKEPIVWTQGVPAMLGQHIPQGVARYNIEQAFKKFLKVDQLGDMDMLKVTGLNQCGRLSFSDTDLKSLPKFKANEIDQHQVQESTDGLSLFNKYLNEPRAEGNQCGIAGAQQKLTGNQIEKQFNITAQSSRTIVHHEVILKATHTLAPSLSRNEKVCMEAGKSIGLQLPQCKSSMDGNLLLIKRFDRFKGRKIGFEDLSGLVHGLVFPHKKVELNNVQNSGTYQDVFTALRLAAHSHSSFNPQLVKDLHMDVIKRIAFSNLMRDSDLHLKNIGVLYTESKIKISPVYDVTCCDTIKFNGQSLASEMIIPWDRRSNDRCWKSIDKLVSFFDQYSSCSHKDIKVELENMGEKLFNWCHNTILNPDDKVASDIGLCVGYNLTEMNPNFVDQWKRNRQQTLSKDKPSESIVESESQHNMAY